MLRTAFNSVRRDVVLKCIKQCCPEAYAMAYQAYSTPTPLLMGDYRIMSTTGVQQGDPLGPIAFALAINSSVRSLKSALNIWYLDDGTIGGSVTDVVSDLRSIKRSFQDLGLQMNASKCEVAVLDGLEGTLRESVVRDVKVALPDISETPLARLQLLGSPIHEDGLPCATDSVLDTISRLCERVHYLDRHTGLFFLAHYVSAPRLIYLLRSTPLYNASSGLQKIDELVRATLSDITNVDVSGPAWEQASLPRRHGGLGVRSVEALALPCYVASLCAAAPLITAISPSSADAVASTALQPAIREFKRLIGSEDIPQGTEAGKQRSWDDLASKTAREQLLKAANQIDRARLLAAASPHTAAWLQAIPSPNLGLHLDADTVRVAVALRLGAPVCESHDCTQCSRLVDRLGLHGLSCKKSAGRFPRHSNLNDVVKRALSSAGIPAVLEPQGLDRGDGKRPDGLTIFPYKQGKSLTWDVTCVDTYAESVLINSSLEPGSAAKTAENRKREKYTDIAKQHIFIPVAVETSGVLGPAAATFLTEIGRRISAVTGDCREVTWLRQRISLAIVRGNAAAVLATACRVQQVQIHPPARVNRLPASSDTNSRPRGLVNLGNTCYVNAVIQALFHTDRLRCEVLAARPSASRPLLAALQRVFAFLAFSARPVYSPDEFQLSVQLSGFQTGRQEDCSEFLRHLLSALHEEERAAASPDVSSVPITSLPTRPAEPTAGVVSQLLNGSAETSHTCCACGMVSRLVSRVTDLDLSLPEALTRPVIAASPTPGQSETCSRAQPEPDMAVSDLLQHYLAPERLSGENQYRCARCAGLRDADRQVRLLALPPHLIISLVRFTFDRHTGALKKALAPVKLSEQLSIPLVGQPAAEYQLYAVIAHAGHSLDAGHYFSFCRVSSGGGGGTDNDWWRLDDTSATPVKQVTVTDRPQLPTDTAYTLMYRLAGAAAGRQPTLAELPSPLRAAVEQDNAEYRRELQARAFSSLSPPGAGTVCDGGHGGQTASLTDCLEQEVRGAECRRAAKAAAALRGQTCSSVRPK